MNIFSNDAVRFAKKNLRLCSDFHIPSRQISFEKSDDSAMNIFSNDAVRFAEKNLRVCSDFHTSW
jgi:hypothetical protein